MNWCVGGRWPWADRYSALSTKLTSADWETTDDISVWSCVGSREFGVSRGIGQVRVKAVGPQGQGVPEMEIGSHG